MLVHLFSAYSPSLLEISVSSLFISNYRPSTATSLIKHIRECVKHAPRELYVMVLMTAGPPGQGSIIAVQMCFAGSREKGNEFHDMIRGWDDGSGCLMNDVGTKLYLMQSGSVERLLRAVCTLLFSFFSFLLFSLFSLPSYLPPSLSLSPFPRSSFTTPNTTQWSVGLYSPYGFTDGFLFFFGGVVLCWCRGTQMVHTL
jgi:hypothetical protein